MKLCDKAIDIGRENKADYTVVAKPMVRVGNVYLKLKDLDRAIENFERSLTEHRNDVIVKQIAKLKKQKMEDAKKAYIDPIKAEEERESGNTCFKNGMLLSIYFHNTSLKLLIKKTLLRFLSCQPDYSMFCSSLLFLQCTN